MRTRFLLVVVALVAGALVSQRSAVAGGWATMSFEEGDLSLTAGRVVQLGVMVKQHGETPIHFVNSNPRAEVRPILTARHVGSTATVTANAVRDDRMIGRFTVDLTLPLAGEWQVYGTPRPFAEVYMTDLRVTGALSATDEGGVTGKASSAPAPVPDAGSAAPARPAPSSSGPDVPAVAGVVIAAVVVIGLAAGGVWRWQRRRGSLTH